MEVEAKFSVPNEQVFRRLLQTPILAGFSLGKATVSDLHDRYLDTADWAFRASGYACRLRRTDDRCLATLKGLGSVTGAIHRRVEHEVELAGPLLPHGLSPREWAPSSARDLALRLCGSEPLITLFEIEQTRHSRFLGDGDRAVAEFNLDNVHVYRRDARQSIATFLELEAELLPDGSEEDLERLATELQEVWGLTPQSRSKYERGLALVRLPSELYVVPENRRESEDQLRCDAALALAQPGEGGMEQGKKPLLSDMEEEPAANSAPATVEGVPAERPSPVPIEVEPVAGPRLFSDRVQLPKRPGVEPGDLMSEAGRKTFAFHFRRMLYHEPGTREGEDIKALHDMRVATRRMRAAFRVFGDFFDPKVVAPHLKGLKRTGRALGAVRDLDVFRLKIQVYLDALSELQRGGLDDLLAVWDEQREAARQRMNAYLDSEKYRGFVERFDEFVETEGMGSLPISPDGGEPRPHRVRHVAPMAVYGRLAAVRAYDEWVTIPDPPLAWLHQLRIACKGLRYTLEFFGEVLGPEAGSVIEEVVTLQDHLGELQDAVVACGILRDFLVWGTWGHDAVGVQAGVPIDKRRPDPEPALLAPGVAAYLAAKESERQHLVDTFPPAWQRLNGPEFSRLVAEAVSVL